MGEQRGFAPLLTVDLAFVTVDLNLRESGARFPCKWSSVHEIYTAEFWAIRRRRKPRSYKDRVAVCLEGISGDVGGYVHHIL